MLPRVHAGRFTADLDGDFVVFLIGMRINKPWRVWEWWRVFVAMPLMLRELDSQPNPPLLGWRLLLASPLSPTVLQYWRSTTTWRPTPTIRTNGTSLPGSASSATSA